MFLQYQHFVFFFNVISLILWSSFRSTLRWFTLFWRYLSLKDELDFGLGITNMDLLKEIDFFFLTTYSSRNNCFF